MSDVGWPRLTRNAEGRPMWDQGPLGMSVVLASIPLPERWPEHWTRAAAVGSHGVAAAARVALDRVRGALAE